MKLFWYSFWDKNQDRKRNNVAKSPIMGELEKDFDLITKLIREDNNLSDSSTNEIKKVKIRFFKNARKIIGVKGLEKMIADFNDISPRDITWEYMSYSTVYKVFESIFDVEIDETEIDETELESTFDNEGAIYEEQKNNSKTEESAPKMEKNNKKTENKLIEEIGKTDFDWEDLKTLLKIKYPINKYNFDDILKDIKKYGPKTLKNKYEQVLYIKNNMKIKELELKQAFDDLLFVIKENMWTKEEKQERKNEMKNEIKKEKELEKQKKILQKEFSNKLWDINTLIIDTENEIKKIKKLDKKDVDINKFLENFTWKINSIFNKIKMWISKHNLLSWTIKDIDLLLNTYNRKENKDFLHAIKNWYLLWDIYELILNIEEKNKIVFEKTDFNELDKKFNEYKLKASLNNDDI